MIAVERNDAHRLGRVRLAVADRPGSLALVDWAAAVIEPGSTIKTDGAPVLRRLADRGFTHQATAAYSAADQSSVLPGVHLVASLLKRWLIGTLHYRVEQQHLPYYLDEYTFRFNRRTARSRGLLFYRLLQQAVNTDPHPLHELLRPETRLLGRLHLSGYAEHMFERRSDAIHRHTERLDNLQRAEPPGHRDQSLPAAAPRQPRRLVGVGAGGVRGRGRTRRPGVPLGGLLRVPLVPRHGPRVVRGRRGVAGPQRGVRRGEGRPRGAPRRRRRLHGRDPGADRSGRLADDRADDPGSRAVLLWDLLPQGAAAAGARRGLRRVADPPRRGPGQQHPHRGSAPRGHDSPATCADHRPSRRCRRGPASPVRLRQRRIRARPEVPAVARPRVPAAPSRPHRRRRRPRDGRRHLHGDGPRRDLRPAGRRFRALRRRHRLGRAALREDALRQRAADPGLRPLVAGHRVAARRAGRARDRGLPGARPRYE